MTDMFVSARTAAFPGGALLDGVYVSLHNAAGALLASGYTGDLETGTLFLGNRAAGTYEIRVTPATGVVTPSGRQTVTVAVTDTDPVMFDVLVDVSGIAPPTDARFCRCAGRFVDSSGRPFSEISLTFSEYSIPQVLHDAGSDTVVGVLPRQVSVITDSAGYAQIDLIRDATYNVLVSPMSNTSIKLLVPDAATSSLPDLLFQTVDRIEYFRNGVVLTPIAAPTLTMTAGESVELALVTVYRGGYRVMGLRRVSLYVEDDNVVILSLTGGTNLTIQAVEPGTATIEVHRSETQETTIYPAPAAKGFIAVTVNP